MNLVFKKLNLKVVINDRATYSIAEFKDFIDFEAKRIYFIQDCKQPTGQHCHKVEKELFVMIKGKCTAVIDRGNGKEDVVFNSPGEALYAGNYVWHGFKDFSADAVLLAVSSTNFIEDRSDYIEDYEEYRKIIAE
jgi:uncharacterized cupin superfamily protein